MLKEYIEHFSFEKPLILYVLKDNKPAIDLYKKIGFAITGNYGEHTEFGYREFAYIMQYKKRKLTNSINSPVQCQELIE